MIELNLATSCQEHELIKEYLQENVSEILAEKINNGVRIEKDGKTFINKKTLEGFMKYAQEEARKLAEKGANFKAVHHSVVFGWAIHYFEEDSIEGTLFNEDGSEYKKPVPTKKKTANTTQTVKPVSKPKDTQFSLFDLMKENEEPKQEQSNISTKEDLPCEDFDLSEEEMQEFDGDISEPTDVDDKELLESIKSIDTEIAQKLYVLLDGKVIIS